MFKQLIHPWFESFMTQNFVISSYYLPSISRSVLPLTFVSSTELAICESSLVESVLNRFFYVNYLRPAMRYGQQNILTAPKTSSKII